MALAGGVGLMITPEIFISLCAVKALAKDGRCKTFDASGDGYGRGEGGGLILLKPLSKALQDNDPILAVIKSSAVNQDGPGSGLTVPNGQAQVELLKTALKEAHLEANDINYLETHGTGTSLGDPIELNAIAKVYGEKRHADNPLIIGSVKANIGHLEAAAGVASVIKSVLCLQNKAVPPQIHVEHVNPRLPLDTIPASIPFNKQALTTKNAPLHAAISSFGFSGTNCHLILEEYIEPPKSIPAADRPLHLFTLSAKNEAALKDLIQA